MKHTSLRLLSVVALLSTVLFVGAGCGKKANNTTTTTSAANINTTSTVNEPTGDKEDDVETIEDAMKEITSAADSADATLNSVDEENVDAYTISDQGI